MTKQKVELTLDRSTKGTHVYKNDEHKLSLYFPKTMVGEEAPATITMTLEVSK